MHHSALHHYDSEVYGIPESGHSHKHENAKDVHHEHHFHVGIFHFLGHLFESISHSNDFADDHLVVIQKKGAKKNINNPPPFNACFDGNGFLVFEVDGESLPDPPYYLSFLQKSKLPNTPLRAPPTFI